MKYLAITAILCLVLAGASFAGNVTMTEVLTGGGLTLTIPSDFSMSSTTLGGSETKLADDGTHSYYVEDSRGTGAGWNLCFQIDQFVTTGTPQRTIPTGNFYTHLSQDSIYCTYGQEVDATNGPKSLITSDTSVSGTSVEGVHALQNYGMGKYELICGHNLVIPASAYAGTYTATMTMTLNNTP